MGNKDLSYRTEGLQFVRFVYELFGDGVTMEVEYLRPGEKQGRIFDAPLFGIMEWLAMRGFPKTSALETAVASALNFGEAAYLPQTDEARPL